MFVFNLMKFFQNNEGDINDPKGNKSNQQRDKHAQPNHNLTSGSGEPPRFQQSYSVPFMPQSTSQANGGLWLPPSSSVPFQRPSGQANYHNRQRSRRNSTDPWQEIERLRRVRINFVVFIKLIQLQAKQNKSLLQLTICFNVSWYVI